VKAKSYSDQLLRIRAFAGVLVCDIIQLNGFQAVQRATDELAACLQGDMTHHSLHDQHCSDVATLSVSSLAETTPTTLPLISRSGPPVFPGCTGGYGKEAALLPVLAPCEAGGVEPLPKK
jgi:hypothetical protein